MQEQMLDEWQASCPYCGSGFTLLIDASQGDHVTYEDCRWCCCPIVVTVSVSLDGELENVRLNRDDDADMDMS
ncbi:CPXCG motif-containing cysteine-rich protein [Phytohalomonas tamaricis]|uniref:CPXCG motif-containing cysteine-rich protein n=1 Tax=Phytohalomonas tamaricis TaxID=2081032 RepID=UPI000D0AEC10|nr:CPXCG motif-containing cysteine-rich protein [Phytohalomonas tamaricis]